MALKNILGNNKKWKEKNTLFDDLLIVRENFINFYKIHVFITFTKYQRKIRVVLYYKGCQCFYKIVSVGNTISIPNYVEDYIKNNYKNLYELPRFVKLLDELELDYDILFEQFHIKFRIPIKKGRGIKWVLVQPSIDDIKELIKRCRCYLLNNWETIKLSGNSVNKYCNEDTDEIIHIDPIFPG